MTEVVTPPAYLFQPCATRYPANNTTRQVILALSGNVQQCESQIEAIRAWVEEQNNKNREGERDDR